jgi:predicted nucleic acid-binding protein
VNPVFLDTVGLLALWDVRDQWHAAASEAFDDLQAAGAELFTTTFILLECGNAAARRPFRHVVDRIRQDLIAAGALIVPTEDNWNAAWESYARNEHGHAGIVDYVSFHVMPRSGATDAFTNDRHFAAAGFRTLF